MAETNLMPVGVTSSSGERQPSSAFMMARERSRNSGSFDEDAVRITPRRPSWYLIVLAVGLLAAGIVRNFI